MFILWSLFLTLIVIMILSISPRSDLDAMYQMAVSYLLLYVAWAPDAPVH